jgi:hypothetical protein
MGIWWNRHAEAKTIKPLWQLYRERNAAIRIENANPCAKVVQDDSETKRNKL